MHHHAETLVGLEARDQRVRDPLGCGDRQAGVHPQRLDPRQRREPRHDVAEPARRQDQRIASRQDHLPQRRLAGDPGDRPLERVGRQQAALRPDMRAPEAEPAIDRAGQHRLEQHAIRVAAHHPLDRAPARVAGRVGALAGTVLELGRIRQHLSRERRRRARGDPRHPGRRHADRVTRAHVPKRRAIGIGRQQSRRLEPVERRDAVPVRHDRVHDTPFPRRRGPAGARHRTRG